MGMRYPIKPTEKIRKYLNLNPEQFSIRIGYSVNAYRKAMKQGTITERMARDISQRLHVPMEDLKDGIGR